MDEAGRFSEADRIVAMTGVGAGVDDGKVYREGGLGSWIARAGRGLTTMIFLFACCAGHAGDARAEAVRPGVEQFFENNAFSGATLSPGGHYLAVRMSKPGRRNFLAVIDLDTRKATAVAEYTNADIGDFQWANDDRLVYNVGDLTLASGDRSGRPGLYAINRDGSNPVQLVNGGMSRSEKAQAWNTGMLYQRGSQDSEWIYVERPYFDKNGHYDGSGVLRLNTLTAEAEDVAGPSSSASAYLLDAHGKLRLAVLATLIDTRIFYLDATAGKWREIASFEADDAKNRIRPVGFDQAGTLYVIANAGEDLATLRTLDPATGKLSKEPLVSTPGYDTDVQLLRNDKLLGVRLTTDATNDIWFDPAMKAIQAAVNKALPATVNLLDVAARPGAPWILVRSYSDRQPPVYRLYDTRSGQFDEIGAPYPGIDPARMGRQEPIRYKARDGLEIPGLLTLPPGPVRKNLPMVALVHGGPWIRGKSWGWDPESQFLASRGYAVLEVEFRGSTGFGTKHYMAGMKQWGLAMQDDIADGVRWAIAQGIADPNRICIAGSSYGGYSALMGLVNDPALYRCAFEWAGVTDIGLMYTGTWYSKPDFSEGYKQYRMPMLIGDLEKDAAQLEATSPVKQAERIYQPLLLAYGSQDARVPLHQGKAFREAVAHGNRHVEWIVYDGEGHGWSLPENRIDFWQRVERFLDRYCGAAPAVRPPGGAAR